MALVGHKFSDLLLHVLKGVEIDQLFSNKFSILPLKAVFLGNVLILQKIIIEMSHRFQQPL